MKLLCRVFRSANFSFRQKKAIKFEIWTLFTCLKEIYQFLGGWFGKLLSGLAQTFQDPLVSQNETPVKVFWLSIFTFQTKESNKIWNLDPLRLLERNLPILGGLIWKAAFSFGQHIPQPFSVTKKNSCGKLYFRLLPFQTKNPIKFEIWTLLACSKEIDQFWGGWFGKLLSGFAQTFHDPSVSKNETLLKVFWLSQFTFQRKESNKIWDLDPIHLLERNLPILGGLIWKAAFSFGQHIPQPFSVTK